MAGVGAERSGPAQRHRSGRVRGPYPRWMELSAPLILDIGIVLLAAAASGWAARRLGLPAVVGYLAAGLAVSPFTPGYVADREQIRLLADIGVVILLFEVGIEIDLGRLRREQRALLWVAPLQVVLSTLAAGVVLVAAGVSQYGAALVGLSVAFSSSVVVVNITRSRRRTTDLETERALLGWSVLQDVTGVSLAAVLLALGGLGDRPLGVALLGFAAYAALAIGAARFLPWLLRRLSGDHDLFLIVSVAAGLALAGIGSVAFGLPLALAAFVAGLAITEAPDTAEVRRRILPFRDVFAVLFFVAIGMLIDPGALRGRGAGLVVLLVGLVIMVKGIVVWVFVRLGRLPGRPVQIAVGLGQIGEFSFVLASAALTGGSIEPDLYAALLVTVVLTIAGSTILVRRVGRAHPPVDASALGPEPQEP